MNSEKFIPEIIEHIPGLVVMYNINTGEYLFVNKAVKKILGYRPEDFIKGGFNFATGLVHPEDLPRIVEENNDALSKANAGSHKSPEEDPIVTFEYRMKHKDGSWRWLYTEGTVFSRNAAGKVELILNVSLDITERKDKENRVESLKDQLETLKESEQGFRSFIQAVEDYAIFRLNAQGNIISWNEGIRHIIGYDEKEILGKHFSIFFTLEDIQDGKPDLELEEARTNGTSTGEGIRIRKDGTSFYASATITAIFNNGVLQGYSKIMRDVTERKEAEETIRFQAMHDTLTGLANRKSLDEHFTQSQSLAIRNKYKLALLFLDLDRFKNINDTLGHGIGDSILKEVAHRLISCVRQADTVVRLGGDEFIILLNEVASVQAAAIVAEKILQSFVPTIRVNNQNLHVTTSIGIAMFPADGQDIYTLLKNADTALYRAKDAGRNRYQFYNYSMNLQSVARLSLEQDLRTAVSNNQLHIVYQPFINTKTGLVMGVEALVRWHHPTLGVLLPYDFIPLAEEIGIIVPMGRWILETVCRQGEEWLEKRLPLSMTVNLSAQQFSDPELVNIIDQALEETGFKANLLELEITESVAMENINRTSSKLNDLKQKGITIAIDDFGTGYSSLSYLKRFPVNKLKIDQSFVKHAITDSQDSTIIRAIISMGHSLGLKVCAEGVEHEQQKALLESMGCDMIQGFFISKPLPAKDLLEWIKNRSKALKG